MREPPRLRRRPFAFALFGASLLAAGAAGAAVILLAGNAAHPGTSLRSFVTAAYTVRPDQDGTITVTIKQLQDPAGLQRALAADGVPALVRYIPARNVSGTYNGTTYNGISPGCQYLNLPLVPGSQSGAVGTDMSSAGSVFWIRPSALPKGSVVFIQDSTGGPRVGWKHHGHRPADQQQAAPVRAGQTAFAAADRLAARLIARLPTARPAIKVSDSGSRMGAATGAQVRRNAVIVAV